MEEVIHYLELKNQYYEKFYNVTAKFLGQAVENRWDDLEFFVDNRERILNIIRSFDFKIAALFDAIDVARVNLDVYRSRVKSLLEKRSALATRIVAVDLELIGKIDEMKSDTIKELKRTLETSQHLSSFEEHSIATPRKNA